MTSIFGLLDKRQRAAEDAAVLAGRRENSAFQEREDLLNDLLEEDTSCFPLLSCPPEVLSAVLLYSEAVAAVRMRPVCSAMRVAIDRADSGLWGLLTLRDFADLGGLTKHYRGLRTLADAWDDSRAVRRLEWDPLMICAPPALRYCLLSAAKTRQKKWDEHGHALGAGWSWFSAKVCRRMAVSTFLRWGSLQHSREALQALLEPLGLSTQTTEKAAAAAEPFVGMEFRCGRSDSIHLSAAAVTDIYETVQKWHNAEHRSMMRAHFEKKAQEPEKAASTPQTFSVTPTLDAAQAAAALRSDAAKREAEAEAEGGAAPGAASHRLEEAQLKLALELSKEEAQAVEKKETPAPVKPPEAKPEPPALLLHGEGQVLAAKVHLKTHCLAERVDSLPEALDKSIEHIVHKMTTASTWSLLYESIAEELGFRSKSAAYALFAGHATTIHADCGDISISQERMCLPIWRTANRHMANLSQLGHCDGDERLRHSRRELLRAATVEWSELEDLSDFLDQQLAPLEQAIDNFRGAHEVWGGQAHTPHVRDVARLQFRNNCLLDSRIFRALCLAAYSLIHEVRELTDASEPDEYDESTQQLLDLLDLVREMIVSCDVADDHLSSSKGTKDEYVEHLVSPITAASERLGDVKQRSKGSPSHKNKVRDWTCG